MKKMRENLYRINDQEKKKYLFQIDSNYTEN